MNPLHQKNITELERLLDYMHDSRQVIKVIHRGGMWHLAVADVYYKKLTQVLATKIDVEVEGA